MNIIKWLSYAVIYFVVCFVVVALREIIRAEWHDYKLRKAGVKWLKNSK